MNLEHPEPEPHDLQSCGTNLSAPTRWSIYAYLGALMTMTSLGDPNGAFLDVPFSFVLKNAMGLDAQELSAFRLIAGAPLYASILFGLVRDNWSPFGLGDRGHILIFSVASTMIFCACALLPVSIATLLVASIVLTSLSLFVASAQNGLAASIGQQHAMTGRISTTWNIATALPSVLLFGMSGFLSQSLSGASAGAAAQHLYFVGAAASLLTACFALWKPGPVYRSVRREHGFRPQFTKDLLRLARHRPVYPALLIWLLWNFAPGSATPLQYHLQNALGAADWQWGAWNAIFTVSFIPTFVLFGLLCRHVTLRRLLWWSTIVALPEFIPLLFGNSVWMVLALAIPAGLMGGLATAAYVDLTMRSAPPGLQGTMLMAASSLYFIATRFGDVLGSYVYNHTGGFTACVVLTTICYGLILPVLRWIPSDLIATSDGESGTSSEHGTSGTSREGRCEAPFDARQSVVDLGSGRP